MGNAFTKRNQDYYRPGFFSEQKQNQICRTTPAPDFHHAVIYCDGSCPSNPGPIGIGYQISILPERDGATGYVLAEVGTRFENGTNNQAEYFALIFALRHALRAGVTHVKVFTDSLLISKQVNKSWVCRESSLKGLCEEAQGLLAMFTVRDVEYIPREENTIADELSKNPTDSIEHIDTLTVNLKGKRTRKVERHHAAMIRWWWKTRRCTNEYRLARIFNIAPSYAGKIGRGESFKDLSIADLPSHATEFRLNPVALSKLSHIPVSKRFHYTISLIFEGCKHGAKQERWSKTPKESFTEYVEGLCPSCAAMEFKDGKDNISRSTQQVLHPETGGSEQPGVPSTESGVRTVAGTVPAGLQSGQENLYAQADKAETSSPKA